MGVIVLAVAASGLTGIATSALFTDTDTIAANTFTTGSVTLSTNPTTAAIAMANMVPGDKVTRPITVTNAGSMSLRYSVLSTTDALDANVLAPQLDLTIKTGVTTCDNANFGSSGVIAVGTATGDLGSTTGTKVMGDAATGPNTGDRTLAPGSEILCLQVELPIGVGSGSMGKTTTATFKFDSEQTLNNP